jgi:hypothetical protein
LLVIKKLVAKFTDQYAWVGKGDGFYVFSAEIDHIDPNSVDFNFQQGTFTNELTLKLRKQEVNLIQYAML